MSKILVYFSLDIHRIIKPKTELSHCILLDDGQEALRTRGLKDDTTCIVVDIIPPDNSAPPSLPPKKQNKFRALLFRKRSHDSASKLSRKLSAVGIVEELFEEGSAMLAERFDTCLVHFFFLFVKKSLILSFGWMTR